MGENDTHRPGVHDFLHESIAALVRDPHKGCYTRQHGCLADVARIREGKGRVLEVDEEAVESGVAAELRDVRVCYETDAEGL